MCERIKNLLAGIMGDQSKQSVVSETPPHLCESIDPLARVRQEIAEYKARCNKLGYAECKPSFGTLTREGQQLFLDEFATDEGRDKEGANSRIYQTSLQDEDGSALFIRTFGDFGVQIDWRGFD